MYYASEDGQNVTFWDHPSLPADPKVVGIKLSGGTDSAMVFLLACEYFKDKDVSFIPFVKNPMSEVENTPFAQAVVDILRKRYPSANISDPYPYYTGMKRTDIVDGDVAVEHNMDVMLAGVVLGPPLEIYGDNVPELAERRQLGSPGHQNQILPLKGTDALYYDPLFYVNKLFVKHLYDHFNAMEDLYPVTKSCLRMQEPGAEIYSHFKDQPCKTCFNCIEKKWAFGTYDFGIV